MTISLVPRIISLFLISLCLLYNVTHLSPRALLICNLAAFTLLQFRLPSASEQPPPPPPQGQTNNTFLSSECFGQLKGLLSLADLFKILGS